MRILIYGLNFAPELTGIGKYTGEMAEWLASHGHEVRVVTAPPYYPAWRVWEEYRAKSKWYCTETHGENLTVYRCPLWVPEKPTGMKRILHLISFALSSFPMALLQVDWNPDVVFAVEPSIFSAAMAYATAKLIGTRSWLHVQDFEVDAAFELGMLPSHGPVRWLAVNVEEWITSHFDRVSSISRKMVEKSIAKGLPEYKAVLFPNWVDIDFVRPLKEPSSYRTDLQLEDKTIVLYSGNMGNKQGLEVLAPLAAACQDDPSLHFVFCGDGAYRPKLEADVRALANVTLLSLQPLEKLNALLNAADIHLLPQRAGAADLVMPSKLTGMLSSGRPVVATAEVGTQVAMVVDGCGLVIPPENPGALVEAVKALAADAEMRARMGEAARSYAEKNLGREEVLLQFERELSWLMRAGRRERPRAEGDVGRVRREM